MATISESLQSLGTTDLIARTSSMLGETEGGVSRAFSAGISTVLAALMNRFGDSGIMRQIMDMLTNRAVDPSIARNPGALLTGNGIARSPATELGSRFLSLLFGPQTSSVANAIADQAGIKPSSASTLLGLAAPLVMATLGDRVQRDGLDASGLVNLLSSQRDSILKNVPTSLTGLLGLGAGTRMTTAGDAYRTATRTSRPWLGAAIAGVLALAALWAISRARGPQQVANVPDQPLRLANAVADRAGAFDRRLPNGFEISAPASGIEREMVLFVEDPSANVNTATWFNFDRLLFETGSAKLKPESTAQLKNVAEIMKAYPNVKAKVGGYTDNVGNESANLKLSQDRATAVVTELIALGVPPDRLGAEGYGADHPVADNSTEEGRQQNRRIAMRVIQK